MRALALLLSWSLVGCVGVGATHDKKAFFQRVDLPRWQRLGIEANFLAWRSRGSARDSPCPDYGSGTRRAFPGAVALRWCRRLRFSPRVTCAPDSAWKKFSNSCGVVVSLPNFSEPGYPAALSTRTTDRKNV